MSRYKIPLVKIHVGNLRTGVGVWNRTCVVVRRRRFDAYCLCLLQFLLTFTEDDAGKRCYNDYYRDSHHKDYAKHPVPPARHGQSEKQTAEHDTVVAVQRRFGRLIVLSHFLRNLVP